MEKKRRRWWIWLIVVLAAAILAAAVWFGIQSYLIYKSNAPSAEFDPGAWIELAPDEIVSADGMKVRTEMRVGSENKVIVFFYGGGMSINEFTAARPYTGARFAADEIGFYADDIEGMIPDYCQLGLSSNQRTNPFRDWSVIIIPYTTADFHLGTADYTYTALDGTKRVLHHHGYTNYKAIMDEAVKYLDSDPEELLVTGWSAGGFGAAALADDVYENYFPEAGHVTVCIDSSVLIVDGMEEIVSDLWGAPAELAARFTSDNLLVDLMSALYEKYGDEMTYLYIGSTRDGALSKYQNYVYTGFFQTSNQLGRAFTTTLRETLWKLRQKIPGLGVYLFDDLPYSVRPNQMLLTQHTVLLSVMMSWQLTDRTTPLNWIYDATRGDIRNHGERLIR